ncbi:MAG TPA: transcription termination factor NusA [Chloroflexota bacterium]|nr:transcription termination factor NusA [Chloroflexota bacterium]
MNKEFFAAIAQVSSEKGVSTEVVLESLKSALAAAYQRSYEAEEQDIRVELDNETAAIQVFRARTVVDGEAEDARQIGLEQASALRPGIETGAQLVEDVTPTNFGRIAAQTAKQVIQQRMRDAERDKLYQEYVTQQGDILLGTVQRIEPSRAIYLDLGRVDVQAVMPPSEQIPTEHFRPGQRVRVLVLEVQKLPRGPVQIICSRANRGFLRRLFELEVPELKNGAVEIRAIAREPGQRTKVAVYALQPGVDAQGSCIGQRGQRVMSVVNEVNGEKIDVVAWDPDPAKFVENALSPAQVISVHMEDGDKTAQVVVPDRQLSLAIGKEGQNARLAARLTGWRIDIKATSRVEKQEAGEDQREDVSEEAPSLA